MQDHQVYIERNAGVGSGFMTEDYVKAGAIILESAKEVWATADMIVKVKEPLPDEYPLFRKGQIIYTYLHLAADRALTMQCWQQESPVLLMKHWKTEVICLCLHR